MSSVNVMGAPTGNHAGAELFQAQPSGAREIVGRHYAIQCVWNLWSGSQPGIVIESPRNGHWVGIAAGGIARQTNFNLLDGADATVAHKSHRAGKLLPRTLL